MELMKMMEMFEVVYHPRLHYITYNGIRGNIIIGILEVCMCLYLMHYNLSPRSGENRYNNHARTAHVAMASTTPYFWISLDCRK